MLVGWYQGHSAATIEFTSPECSDNGDGFHTASCIVTARQSAGGSVLSETVAKLPVPRHMEHAAIVEMFQAQFSAVFGMSQV